MIDDAEEFFGRVFAKSTKLAIYTTNQALTFCTVRFTDLKRPSFLISDKLQPPIPLLQATKDWTVFSLKSIVNHVLVLLAKLSHTTKHALVLQKVRALSLSACLNNSK